MVLWYGSVRFIAALKTFTLSFWKKDLSNFLRWKTPSCIFETFLGKMMRSSVGRAETTPALLTEFAYVKAKDAIAIANNDMKTVEGVIPFSQATKGARTKLIVTDLVVFMSLLHVAYCGSKGPFCDLLINTMRSSW